MRISPNPQIANLAPYQPGKPISELAREFNLNPNAIIKLASNENPLGCSPKIKQAITAELAKLARYPDGASFMLKQKLAKFYQLQTEQITIGNGSNDILDLLARIFLNEQSNAIFSAHAFIVYKLATITSGAKFKEIAAQNYAHDLNAIANAVDAQTKIIFLANPNNPTGSWFKQDELIAFLNKIPVSVLVVLDEAYYEYAQGDDFANGLSLVNKYPNLLVTRTFSKVYGLAGLRIGFAISQPDIADMLNRARQPFNVNSLAQAAAIIALEDQEFVAGAIKANIKGMHQLNLGLEKLGLKVLPTKGNFMAVDFGQDVSNIDLKLQQNGVIVRPIAGYDMPNFLRISIGTEAENARLLQVLAQIL